MEPKIRKRSRGIRDGDTCNIQLVKKNKYTPSPEWSPIEMFLNHMQSDFSDILPLKDLSELSLASSRTFEVLARQVCDRAKFVIPEKEWRQEIVKYVYPMVRIGIPVGTDKTVANASVYDTIRVPGTVKEISYKVTINSRLPLDKNNGLSLPKPLAFGNEFDSIVTKLTLYSRPSYPIAVNIYFPETLTYLNLRDMNYVYSLLIEQLPKQLETLIMNDNFKSSISAGLPRKLKRLDLGKAFNKRLTNLPPGLESLVVSGAFNKQVGKDLPGSLKHLTLGGEYNSPIDDLPENLISLTLGWNFSQPINNLPRGLRTLVTGDLFDHDIANPPPSLRVFKVGGNSSRGLRFHFNAFKTLPMLSPGLRRVFLRVHLENAFDMRDVWLPDTVTALTVEVFYVEKNPGTSSYSYERWHPSNIKLDYQTNYFNNLPPSLQKLHLINCVCMSVDHLPKSLVELGIVDNFTASLNKLPEGLRKLYIINSHLFRPMLDLPPKLETLCLHGRSYFYFSAKIPPTVTVMYASNSVNDSLSTGSIGKPESLATLYLTTRANNITIFSTNERPAIVSYKWQEHDRAIRRIFTRPRFCYHKIDNKILDYMDGPTKIKFFKNIDFLFKNKSLPTKNAAKSPYAPFFHPQNPNPSNQEKTPENDLKKKM